MCAMRNLWGKLILILAAVFCLGGCSTPPQGAETTVRQVVQQSTQRVGETVALGAAEKNVVVAGTAVPAYRGEDYYILNNNIPFFSEQDLHKRRGTIELSPLDRWGRCGGNFMIVGPETLPHVKREGIGMVRPSGWKLAKYDFVENHYLYNRSHLLGYQLSGLNADRRNLITGTEYFNKRLMLPYENRVAETAKRGLHIAYRVTPIYRGRELVARGVVMEGYSLEDRGRLHFNVFVYNIEPGVVIDYADGTSYASGDADSIREKRAVEKSIRRHKKKIRNHEESNTVHQRYVRYAS